MPVKTATTTQLLHILRELNEVSAPYHYVIVLDLRYHILMLGDAIIYKNSDVDRFYDFMYRYYFKVLKGKINDYESDPYKRYRI
uniref:Uncharacterized protein n=1 Tax=uncultured prokaryote TaxID=198431 RepID=A0A0H5Q244_9ZZZZ|nr:hypothetical protein [uncultured prokaryote]